MDLVTSHRLLFRAFVVAVLCAAAFVVHTTLFALSASPWAGPVGDFWFFIPDVARSFQGNLGLDVLAKVYGGHRLLFPKLLYLVEYRFFGGENVFLRTCSVALQTLTAVLVVRFIWKGDQGIRRPIAVLLSGLAVVLLFSATQIENFARGWNIHHFLTAGAVTWAIAALVCAREALDVGAARRAWAWLAASVLSAAVASYSMANGLASWPVLLVLALALRLPKPQLGVLAVAALLVVGSFFVGFPQQGTLTAAASRPGTVLRWMAAWVGAPLSWRQPFAGTLLGALALAAAVVLQLRALAARTRPRRAEALFLGLSLFSVGTVFLIAMGRVVRYQDQWGAPRYQTFVMVFWLALWGLALLWSSGPRVHRGVRIAVGALAVAWCAVVLAPAQLRSAEDMQEYASRIRAAHIAIVLGLEERRAYEATLPKIVLRAPKNRNPVRFVPFLERRRLGMFASGAQDFLGLRMGSELEVAEGVDCAGAVTNVLLFRKDEAARMIGWMPEGTPPVSGRIVVTDEEGTVVGLGVRRPHPVGPSGVRYKFVAWARSVPEDSQVDLWGDAGGGAVCHMAGPIDVVRNWYLRNREGKKDDDPKKRRKKARKKAKKKTGKEEARGDGPQMRRSRPDQ